ncbi:hypothetical protein [Izhakiella capsodis]|uniref:hypothetical protein n=1 Tax=Izhakiella capsodis TaxID=1367852 RepID=UPI000B895AEB|nr:hypothetical protein [Izhakiella capsodis]
MKKILIVITFFYCPGSTGRAGRRWLSLTGVPVSQAITVLWRDIFAHPFILAQALVSDSYHVSFSVDARRPTRQSVDVPAPQVTVFCYVFEIQTVERC